MHRMPWAVLFGLFLAACAGVPGGEERSAIAPPQRPAAVVRETMAPVALPRLAPDTGSMPVAPVVVPPNTLYVCVVDAQGVRQQTAIEFAPKVGKLCQAHPEMGPCRYERTTCRRSGGRVFAADRTEITPLIEADYDKRVLRVVFRAD